MKELKELKFEELSVKQKLGMIHAAVINPNDEAQNEFIFERIKEHALGAIWIPSNAKYTDEFLKRVKETADYPILVMTDAGRGLGEYRIGLRNCTGRTGDVENAYVFGKSVGVVAKELGFNVVCSPILDIGRTGSPRSFGSDKHFVAKMAAAEAKGMHDGGILTVGKHYPSARHDLDIDSHMAEAISNQTKEELLEESLYAYKELMKEGLLDGLMTGHHKIPKTDPQYPASLSKTIIDIIKDEGFDGFFITDALDMMGVRARFGRVESKGIATMAGNDLILTYSLDPIGDQKIIDTCYEKGIITDERLDEAVKKVLQMQKRTLELEKGRCTSLTQEEIDRIKNIERNAICAFVDEGLTPSISRDGKHLFVLMVRNEMDISGVDVDTFKSNWLFPEKVKQYILELFPNSKIHLIHQFPTQRQNQAALNYATKSDDVVFMTFSETMAYIGTDHITQRALALIKAMQYTNKISTLIHFGNPCVLNTLPHIPRYILGDTSNRSVEACLDVLAGKLEPKGIKTNEFTLN